MDLLNCALGVYSTFLLLGDFNIYLDDERLREFCNSFSLGHLIKIPTCYMDANPSSIDHIIRNMTFLFMKPCTVETGVSDYHKLIISICRMTFAKVKVKNSFIAVIRILIVNF